MSDKRLEKIQEVLKARYPSIYILESYDFETAQQILDICQPQWIDMESAPKDGTHVLLKFNDDTDAYKSTSWNGLRVIGKNNGDSMFWSFAAPVGMGGFKDECFDGWMPLPEDTA